MKKNLVLVGMMAVGKTTLGKIVAKKQNLEFVDTDLNIEKKNSMTINEIFNKKGEIFFRKEEEKEVLESLKKKNCVIALGGGAFLNDNLRKNILKDALSIWLDVDLKTNTLKFLNTENNKEVEAIYDKIFSVFSYMNCFHLFIDFYWRPRQSFWSWYGLSRLAKMF